MNENPYFQAFSYTETFRNMKKTATILSLFLIMLSASAQERFTKSFRLGFTTSPSVNWMSSGKNEISRGKAIAGFDFGLNADFFFDMQERYAFTTGLLVSSTGGELDFYLPDDFIFAGEVIKPGSSIRYRLQYLEVPLAIKLKTSDFQRWSYWGQFGLSGFMNIGAKGTTNDGVLDKTDINREIKLFNLAMNLGIGSEYDLGRGNSLQIGLVFKNGFVDVTKDKSIHDKTILNSLQLKLGLVF